MEFQSPELRTSCDEKFAQIESTETAAAAAVALARRHHHLMAEGHFPFPLSEKQKRNAL